MPVVMLRLDDFEVALEFPVGDRVPPLPPFPFTGGSEVIDEGVAEPVARDARSCGSCVWFRSTNAVRGNVLSALVGAGDRRCGELEALLDTVQAGGDQCSGGKVGLTSAPGQRSPAGSPSVNRRSRGSSRCGCPVPRSV